ncbi:TPA: hypothetical protein SLE25_000664 [Morganella morganii]|nr:hypothetical protein [Morganella morganii]
MVDIKVPFKYCRIERAAKLLDIDVDDIINMAANDYIQLCVNFFTEPARLNFKVRDHDGSSLINLERMIDCLEPLYFGNDKGLSNITSFLFSEKQRSDLLNSFNQSGNTNDYVSTYFSKTELLQCYADGYANGLWAVPVHAIIYLELNGFCNFDDGEFYIAGIDNSGFEKRLSLKIGTDNNYKISKSDLWITKETVKAIANSDFDLDKISTNEINHRYIKSDIDSTKSNNVKNNFIKSLLHIHYGDDVAENPRRFMDNKDSEISNDFRNQKITPPSGKAVQEWLKFTEIPFKSQE